MEGIQEAGVRVMQQVLQLSELVMIILALYFSLHRLDHSLHALKSLVHAAHLVAVRNHADDLLQPIVAGG